MRATPRSRSKARPPGLAAQAIAFDPTDDLAVLRVPGLGLPALASLPSPSGGAPGRSSATPKTGPSTCDPARIGQTEQVLTQDAYGHGPVSRLLTPLRGLVRPGNSGGPVVDSSGGVLTTVFAGTTGSGPPGGYGVANATVADALARARRRASRHRPLRRPRERPASPREAA